MKLSVTLVTQFLIFMLIARNGFVWDLRQLSITVDARVLSLSDDVGFIIADPARFTSVLLYSHGFMSDAQQLFRRTSA